MVSTYNYLRMPRSFWHAADGSGIYGKNPLMDFCAQHSFSEFVTAVCVSRTLDDRHIWCVGSSRPSRLLLAFFTARLDELVRNARPQSEFVKGPIKHIVRFETLQEDLDLLEQRGILRKSVFEDPSEQSNTEKSNNKAASKNASQRDKKVGL